MQESLLISLLEHDLAQRISPWDRYNEYLEAILSEKLGDEAFFEAFQHAIQRCTTEQIKEQTLAILLRLLINLKEEHKLDYIESEHFSWFLRLFRTAPSPDILRYLASSTERILEYNVKAGLEIQQILFKRPNNFGLHVLYGPARESGKICPECGTYDPLQCQGGKYHSCLLESPPMANATIRFVRPWFSRRSEWVEGRRTQTVYQTLK